MFPVRLDFDYAFEVSHHFLVEYSSVPVSEVVLAAATQQNKIIRLGTMELMTSEDMRSFTDALRQVLGW